MQPYFEGIFSKAQVKRIFLLSKSVTPFT